MNARAQNHFLALPLGQARLFQGPLQGVWSQPALSGCTSVCTRGSGGLDRVVGLGVLQVCLCVRAGLCGAVGTVFSGSV